jgi:hypothetical protein
VDRSSNASAEVSSWSKDSRLRHVRTAAIGGVTALGAEAAAAVPARRAVFGGDDSSPVSSRSSATALTVLATMPFVLTWQSVLVARHRAARAWRGLPDDVPELTD